MGNRRKFLSRGQKFQSSGELSPRHEWDPERRRTLSPRGWENGGSRGRKPPGGGLWGVSPHETKRGGELPPLTSQPRVGPKTLANPWPTGVGKRGARGAKPPMAGGCGGCPPTKPKEGASCLISNPATSGTQNAGKPSASEGGKWGANNPRDPPAMFDNS